MTAPSPKAQADFAEAVRLLCASPEEQQTWLSCQQLAGLPEELALQFDYLSRIPGICDSALDPLIDALNQSLERVRSGDWSRPDLLQSEAWIAVREAAARLWPSIRTDI